MSTFEPYGRLPGELPGLLVDIASPRIPDYTDDVLAVTAATRQRPRWTFLERWLPMIITRQRVAMPALPWRPLLAVVAILALVAASLYVAASQTRIPPPFGPARNGAIAYDENGDIFIRDTLDGVPRPLVVGPTDDFAASFTRDGRHLTFLRRTAGAEGSADDRINFFVADLDGSHALDVSGPLFLPNWSDVSPDDSTAILHAADPTVTSFGNDDLRSRLYRVDLRHPGAAVPIDLAVAAATSPSFRGPTGAEIVFRGFDARAPGIHTGVFAAHPDGSGLRALTPVDGDMVTGYQQPLLSPDGRLLTYTSWDPDKSQLGIHIRDIDTGAERLITEPSLDEGSATFSPDGSRISFVRYSDGYDQIMIMPIAPGSIAVRAGLVYPQVDGQYITSTFSPDGKWLVVNDTGSKDTRVVDALTGGDGLKVGWPNGGPTGWQRLAP